MRVMDRRAAGDVAQAGRQASSERGVAIIELAIVLPMLILLFFGAIELVRALQMQERMTVLTKEAANIMFRDCLELDEPALTQAAGADACMNKALADIDNASRFVMPGALWILSLYDKDSATPGNLKARVSSAGAPASRFDTNPVPNGLLLSQGKIVTAEVFFTYRPLFHDGVGGSNIIPVTTQLYDATMY